MVQKNRGTKTKFSTTLSPTLLPRLTFPIFAYLPTYYLPYITNLLIYLNTYPMRSLT